jgi:hypothetical protein
MFRMTLYVQWRWARLITWLGAIVSFGVPLLSVQEVSGPGASTPQAMAVLEAMRSWSVVYPVLAAALAVLTATAAWGPDHRGRHVYALSLPVPRWRYALLKLGAGAALLVVPVLSLWLGAALASATVDVPPGLRTYAGALALRFALAVTVGYGVFFAISASTARTAGIILTVIGGLVAAGALAGSAGVEINMFDVVHAKVLDWPGPFAVFTGRWMLIDV